ncbi:MAG TPA: fumarylacetoacetate hydrolase family protein [Bradyrhizobium sp.]|nr:fumarylacetoacetate hydrolase family protein [Bradyrhizobium sp.]
MSPRESERAAALLLEARANRRWLSSLPDACRPRDVGEAYEIQQRVASRLGGPIRAWKVGAGSPTAEPAYAAITDRTLFESGVTLPRAMFNIVGLEAEIAFRFGQNLPAGRSYTKEEVLAAIESVHPAIEISDTRFTEWASQDRASHVADQLNHGALIIGAGDRNWRRIDPAKQRARIAVGKDTVADATGKNPAGDLFRLLHWLVNQGAAAEGGIKVGAIVTTGSLTGVSFVKPPVYAIADLPGLGAVHVSVA